MSNLELYLQSASYLYKIIFLQLLCFPTSKLTFRSKYCLNKLKKKSCTKKKN